MRTAGHVAAILGGLACLYGGAFLALVGLVKVEAWLQRRNRARENT